MVIKRTHVGMATLALLVAVMLPMPVLADDEIPLYFHFSDPGVTVPGGVSVLFMDENAPAGDSGTKLDLSSPNGTTRSFDPFLSPPFSQTEIVPRASGAAHLYLAVNQKMNGCADIFFDLYKKSTGGSVWLGGGELLAQTIRRRRDGALNTAFNVPYTIQASLADRTVAVGEGLMAVVSIANHCTGNKGVDFWIDAAAVASNTGGVDNCPNTPNPSQADGDDDGIGDVCDDCTDADGDGFGDPGHSANSCPDDDCPSVSDPTQSDLDGDSVGDACDPCTDTDGDGLGNPGFPANTCPPDNCPNLPGADQSDDDNDGAGNICDNCPAHQNPSQADDNADGIGDDCECTSAAPGLCFWGGGSSSSDCKLEWLVSPPQSPDKKGRMVKRAECQDGSACDADGVADGTCTFMVSLCLNNQDPRRVKKRTGLPVCVPDEVLSLNVIQKCDRAGDCDCVVRDKTCDPELSALEATVSGLPSGAVNQCYPPVPVTVALKGPNSKGVLKKNKKKITAEALTSLNSRGKPGKDKDSLVLVCLP